AKTDLEMLQSHNVTKILLCQDEIVILSCGKILTRLGVDDIGLAIITMFSHFYLLDLNYPACWWAVFTFIQFAIFGEKEEESVQEQFRDQWKKEWKEFTSYLSSREEEEVLND
uniref:Uncharacterized protein n=1 Tax=Clytia hemisphaerica TaxID=252671 RepID=A0A7M5VG32_9CNID